MSVSSQQRPETRNLPATSRVGRVVRGLPARATEFFAQPRWWVEMILVVGLYEIYTFVRNLGGTDVARSFGNGSTILEIERSLHIDVELSINRWVQEHSFVADASALYYNTLHWWVTIGVAIWLYSRHRHAEGVPRIGIGYRKASLVLAVTTLIALAGFYLIPTAPPRMYHGYVDIGAQTATWGWWAESGSPGPESFTNQFAAMPSLHAGWAIWCGLMIVLHARRTWVRVVGVLYPIVTVFVVVGTANHYLLDVVAVGVAIAVAWVVVGLPRRQAAETAERRAVTAGRSAA
ncbi:phosphatase PAP2 family protein [Gordonia rhizosphera]|nr:phosphatase PAP2 family protein [Gordonia rhizosphera]